MAEANISKGGCVGTIIVALLFVFVIGLWTCTYKIPANSVGVRTVYTGEGVEKKDYGPGFVFAVPGLHKVTLWDPTWTDLFQTVQIRGSDQYTTTVDVSVLFRIAPNEAHVAAINFVDYDHISQLVKSQLGKTANEYLAQMKTEDFYTPAIRVEKAKLCQEEMDKQLRPYGIEVSAVLLRKIVYDPKFEKQLTNKQLANQRKQLESSKGLLAKSETDVQLIEKQAEADVKRINEEKLQEIENLKAQNAQNVSKLTQDAKLEAATIVSKAESSRRQKLAQAAFLKASAEAAGTAALSRVYSKPGAGYYFARKAIEGLKLEEIEVNTNVFNPLDSEHLLKALGLDLHAVPAPAKTQP